MENKNTTLHKLMPKHSERHPELITEVERLINYLESTMDDKYEAGSTNITLDMIRYHKHGWFAALWNVMRYMHRYSTEGFDKSSGPKKDLLKAIHYILFILVHEQINSSSNNE